MRNRTNKVVTSSFHLLQDVRDNLISPISHKTNLFVCLTLSASCLKKGVAREDGLPCNCQFSRS